jgi:hypothetical protein
VDESATSRGGFAAQASRAQALVVGPLTLDTHVFFQPNIDGPKSKCRALRRQALPLLDLVALSSSSSLALAPSLRNSYASAQPHRTGGGEEATGEVTTSSLPAGSRRASLAPVSRHPAC